MNQGVVVIIPAYNEERTIGSVVSAAVACTDVSYVLVVSDASTDTTVARATEAGARVLVLPKQSGKGAALRAGLAHSHEPVVVFLDGDLYGLTSDHVSHLLTPVLSGDVSMCIGLRDRGSFWNRIACRLPLVGGERALVRTVFEEIPAHLTHHFMVEIALNFSCRSRQLAYRWILLHGVKIRTKVQKVGLVRALPQYIRMWAQVAWAYLLLWKTYRLCRF